jgi:hypothetical protein
MTFGGSPTPGSPTAQRRWGEAVREGSDAVKKNMVVALNEISARGWIV